MALEFVVEDGTGLTTATSYVELSDAKQYWDNVGYDYSEITDDSFKALLNAAVKTIDGQYFARFKGYRSSSTQALQWPRADVWYPDGYSVGSTTIPKELKRAVYEMAYAKNSGTTVQPTSEIYGDIKSERTRIEGAIDESREYFPGTTRNHPIISAVEDALRPLLGGGKYGSISFTRSN